MLEVGSPQKEEIVEVALFAPGCIPLVFAQLVVAQAFEGFALPPRLLKDSLLLVSESFPTRSLTLYCLALLAQPCFALQSKPQFRGRGACSQCLRLAELHLPNPVIELFEEMAHFCDLLVRRPQTQLLLVLDTLPEMQQRL
jgi:hypothetical protein